MRDAGHPGHLQAEEVAHVTRHRSASWLLPLTVFLPWLGAGAVLAAGRAARLRTRPRHRVRRGGRRAVRPPHPARLEPRRLLRWCIGGAFGELSLLPGRVRRVPRRRGGGDRRPGRGLLRGLHARRRGTGPVLRAGALLHRRHGRAGSLREPPDGRRVLGDHGPLLVGAHLVPQRRPQGRCRRHQGAHRHGAGRRRASWPAPWPSTRRSAPSTSRRSWRRRTGSRRSCWRWIGFGVPGRRRGEVRAVPVPDVAAGRNGSARRRSPRSSTRPPW